MADSGAANSDPPSPSKTKQSLPRGNVARIVLTGGPCGGKTTAQSRLSDFFENLGWKVYRVPETATILLGGGVKFPELTTEQACEFQENLLKTMMRIENVYFDLAKHHTNENVIIICDRGLMDATAFIEPEEWAEMRQRNGWTEIELRDERYDHIVHVVSAAQGAEDFYSLENNSTRKEDIPLARMLDARAQGAWIGHPYLDVIDNSTGFNEKMLRVLEAITTRLSVPTHDRFAVGSRKRKFLIKSIPEEFPGKFVDFEVQHNYLATVDGSQARIRRRGQGDAFTFTHTIRRFQESASDGFYETRLSLSLREYQALLLQTSQQHGAVHKTRRCFTWEQQYYQLDIFKAPFPTPRCQSLILLELYTTNAGDLVLPEFLEVEKEVTGQSYYSMYNLAKLKEAS